MTSTEAEQADEPATRTIELPPTRSTQRALHEAVGHLYDELAVAEGDRGDDHPSQAVFEGLEELYVATAEESVSTIEISYQRE